MGTDGKRARPCPRRVAPLWGRQRAGERGMRAGHSMDWERTLRADGMSARRDLGQRALARGEFNIAKVEKVRAYPKLSLDFQLIVWYDVS